MKWLRYIAVLGVMVLGVVVMGGLLLAVPNPWPAKQIQGVTFSQPHATGIGLDWREAYDAIVEDLGVKNLRLSAYWDVVEPEDGVFDFVDLDYQMDKAADHEAQVILGVGRKLPRWPECHVPEWAKDWSEESQQERVLEMMREAVERYKHHPALRMWQLENEPFLDFGVCPPADKEFLRRQEELIRLLDGDKPIMVTDSGELSSWMPISAYGDVFGTTMYRTVFSKRTLRPFHYDYLFPAWSYRARARLLGWLRDKEVLVSELQGEPWLQQAWSEAEREERDKSFSPRRFRQIYLFAQRTQLPEVYWWGVEYWYWVKKVDDDSVFWDMARDIFQEEV